LIGKVIRGKDVKRLLYYLFGPGKANEHLDPHLVAGFGDPGELEPERRPDGTPDVRRLAGLLEQPLAALRGPGYDKPVWHCAVRAAPGDRDLSDQEWAQIAAAIMDRTGLAPADDEVGVRWVAVRHATDHIHLVATLARQDGARPRIWNDFYRVREACLEAEQRFGLSVTAPADRTAPRRPARAETEQAARRGWAEAPRTRLRREVCTAAAGARTEQEFLARLGEAGVLVRLRYSSVNPEQVTGYAVGLPDHTAKDGGTIWYGGGKLAADLTLPKVRGRWAATGTEQAAPLGWDLPLAGARGLLRAAVIRAAERAPDEAGFFARLRANGVLVRIRFSELNPGEVTGYSVAMPRHVNGNGEPVWYGGGRLAAGLSLPRLRRTWSHAGSQRPAHADHHGAARLTIAERNAVLDHAARYAATATDHIRWCASHDPARAADAAHAAADALHMAAAVTRSKALRSAADCYDRAARMRYGRTPTPTREGRQLRAAARMLALTGRASPGDLQLVTLIAKLAALATAVIELRQAQQHAAQAAAARAAAARLREHCGRAGSSAVWHTRSLTARPDTAGQSRRQTPPMSTVSPGQAAGSDGSRARLPPQSAQPGRRVRR
jgi:hypothetical protein